MMMQKIGVLIWFYLAVSTLTGEGELSTWKQGTAQLTVSALLALHIWYFEGLDKKKC